MALARAELELEHPAEDIVDDESTEIADVRRRVHRRPAVVETEHAVRLGRSQRLQLTLE